MFLVAHPLLPKNMNKGFFLVECGLRIEDSIVVPCVHKRLFLPLRSCGEQIQNSTFVLLKFTQRHPLEPLLLGRFRGRPPLDLFPRKQRLWLAGQCKRAGFHAFEQLRCALEVLRGGLPGWRLKIQVRAIELQDGQVCASNFQFPVRVRLQVVSQVRVRGHSGLP